MPAPKPAMKQIIIDGYQRGLPIREIAALAGTSYESCRQIASRCGVKHPNSGQRGRPWVPSPEKVSQRYANWLRAKKAAAEALRHFE